MVANRSRRPLVALAALLILLSAPAPQRPAGAEASRAPTATVGVGPDWRAVVDREAGFALLVPPGHDLARSGSTWYLHGWHEGEPLVPDASVSFLPDVAPRDVIARSFPSGAEVVATTLGPATEGLRVTATYRAADGTPYPATAYLVPAPGGTFRIDRYEDFDWPPFAAVARSFHRVEFVGSPTPGR